MLPPSQYKNGFLLFRFASRRRKTNRNAALNNNIIESETYGEIFSLREIPVAAATYAAAGTNKSDTLQREDAKPLGNIVDNANVPPKKNRERNAVAA